MASLAAKAKDAMVGVANAVATGTVFDRRPQTDAEKRAAIDKMFAKYKSRSFAEVADVTGEDLVAELATAPGSAVVVDCRIPAEREVATIPNSVSREEFERTSAAPGPGGIVCYCTIGYRSGVFGKKLLEGDSELRVRNLHGGILEWCHAGGAVVDSANAPTKKVHVYGSTWNLLPEGFTGVIGEAGKFHELD
mmetsp:Transcript_15994/g.40489  ORF Transcript_15994/g.40489 Transcript_15994/m.40489 type:complete len:193 (+) Transcript_15994:105-683(+)